MKNSCMTAYGMMVYSLACAHQLLEQHAHALLFNVQDGGQLLQQELRIKLACSQPGSSQQEFEAHTVLNLVYELLCNQSCMQTLYATRE
jgi:hypothetical protein